MKKTICGALQCTKCSKSFYFHLCPSLHFYPSIYLLYQFIYLSLSLSGLARCRLTVYLSIYLSLNLFLNLFVYLSVYLSIALSVCLSVCRSVRGSVRLSIFFVFFFSFPPLPFQPQKLLTLGLFYWAISRQWRKRVDDKVWDSMKISFERVSPA